MSLCYCPLDFGVASQRQFSYSICVSMTNTKSSSEIRGAVEHAKCLAENVTPLVMHGSQVQESETLEYPSICKLDQSARLPASSEDTLSRLTEDIEENESHDLGIHICHGPGFIHRARKVDKHTSD